MASFGQDKIRSKRPTYWLCATPLEYCGGMPDKPLKCKFHSTAEQSRSCLRAYLKKMEYKQIGIREFVNPETGRILVLSKRQSRAKPGKGGRYMGKELRWKRW